MDGSLLFIGCKKIKVMSKEKFYVWLEDDSMIEDPNFDSYNNCLLYTLTLPTKQMV